MTDSTISGNRAVGVLTTYFEGANGDGGGISFGGSVLTITDSTISGNLALRNGGGIYSQLAHTAIFDSSITANQADENDDHNGSGGGIFNFASGLAISGSTISRNSASQGGGIVSQTDLTSLSTAIINTTISGNEATAVGGGVLNRSGLTLIQNSTITRNQAPTDQGGGVASSVNQTRTEVRSSIIAGNTSGGDVQFVDGTVNPFASLQYNLVGTGNATNQFNQIGDHTGSDPLLGPLAYNGGPTLTHMLLPGSPAIDAGDPASMVGPFDQRGKPFERIFDGDGIGGKRIDVGAFELQPNPLAGDYNFNGIVDAADYTVWRDTLGSTTELRADGNASGSIDAGDYGFWKSHFGDELSAKGAGSGASATLASPLVLGLRQAEHRISATTFDIAFGSSAASSGVARQLVAEVLSAAVGRQELLLEAWSLISSNDHRPDDNSASYQWSDEAAGKEQPPGDVAGAVDSAFALLGDVAKK